MDDCIPTRNKSPFGWWVATIIERFQFDGSPATQGNGTMVAFTVPSIEKVKEIHSKAISLGASNEGDPGERYDGLYYGAYIRDLDGNKISIFHLLSDANM